MSHEDPLRERYLRRFRIGLVLLAVLAIPAIFHSHAAINSLFNRPGDWIPDSLAEKQDFNEFLKHFSVSELIMIAWDGSDLDSESLERASLVLQPLVEPTEGDADAQDESKELEQSLPDEARAQIARLRNESGLQHPLRWVRSGTETLEQLTSSPVNLKSASAVRRLQGTLVGPDGKQTCLVLSFSERGLEKRRILIPGIRQLIASEVDLPTDKIAVVGGPFEGATVDAESVRSIQVFSPPSALIAALLCLICLRSIPLTASIVAVAVIGEGLVLAAVYYTGTPMNAVLIVLPPLVFVLTVSAGIHLSNYYLDAAADFPNLTRAEAARLAMKAGVPPCSLATGTTVVGLSSLLLVRLEPVRIFGGVASIGVVLTLVLLFLLIPGAMVLTKPRRRSHSQLSVRRGGVAGWAQVWMRRRLARPWPLILTFLVISVGLSMGLTRLESTVNVPRMFLPESDIRRQYAWFEENVAPTVTGELLLTLPVMDDEDDPLKRLGIVGATHKRLLELDCVGGALSAMTFVPSVPTKRSLSATARRSVIRKLIRDPDSSLGRLGFIARDADDEIWRISIRMPQDDEKDFAEALASIRAAVDEVLVDTDIPIDATLTGTVVIVQTSQEVLLRDLFRSFMTAFGVIAVVMVLMLRSVIGGLIAMAPNLFPTIALFGLMGLARIPLDIGSVMSASVALGIAVDDTVHLLSRFGSRRARGLGQIRAAYGALEQCGWAMFQTTLVCGVSLMAYWFSDFVPTSRFSLFMFGLLSSALLGVLLLLPALMSSRLGRWLSHTIGADPNATLFADVAESRKPRDVRRLPTRWQKKSPRAPKSSSLPDGDSEAVTQDSSTSD